MKAIYFIAVLLALCVLNLRAQTSDPAQTGVPAPTAYQVVDEGANYSVWQRTTYEQGPNGEVIPHLEEYKEAATGLHYKDASGNWQQSVEQIQALPQGGASAVTGQHQIFFPDDIYSGTIMLTTPDGLVLKGHPIGLSYDDGEKSVLIAEVTNSLGYLAGANQVIYPNAFTGINADIRCTYRKSGYEEDIILKSQPPTPESLGLKPTANLQVMTEFFNAPEPVVVARTVPIGDGTDIQDQTLGFGQMEMMPGRAFLTSDDDPDDGSSIFVSKQWVETDGRQILVEQIPVDVLADKLAALPLSSKNEIKANYRMASHKLPLPPKRLAKLNAGGQPMLLAKNSAPEKGLVWDYNIIAANQSNYVFQADSTYFVSGSFNLYGTTTIEGGAVIKFAKATATDLNIYGPLNCQTGPYRPAIFTVLDDNSVGDAISGSTGSPSIQTNQSAGIAYQAFLFTNSGPLVAHDFQMRYLFAGITIMVWATNSATSDIWDSQFKFSNTAIIANTVGTNQINLHNVLIQGANKAILGYNTLAFGGENLTIHNVNNLYYSGGGTQSLALTNCLFAGVTNWGTTFTSVNCATNASDAGVFQIVGDGGNYLATNSIYRGAGTSNISPQLVADLATKTTYPPIVYTASNFNTSISFSPQAGRDGNATPDLGFHYCPLDYVFGGCVLSNSLTFTAGTAVGWYETSGSVSTAGQPYSICLQNGANFTLSGTATAPCWDASYNMVQEGGIGNWTGRGYMGELVENGTGSSNEPQINSQFAKWSIAQSMSNFWRDNLAYGLATCSDCEFYGGSMGSYRPSMYFTNCLFFRDFVPFWDQSDAASFTFQNCTFYNGVLAFARSSGQSASFWRVIDTAFDGTAFAWSDNFSGNTNYTQFDYNAYNTNNLSWQTYPYPYPPTYGTLETVGAHDLNVTNYNWEPSWFGTFYLPTNSPLINQGSTTADQVGLYHFTTQTNQVPETNSIVDISYHYVATDTNGVPLDSNGDGIPDYIEDANGNGLVDSGEIGWNIVGDLGLQVIITQPRNGSSLP